jgi:hypothetical protein
LAELGIFFVERREREKREAAENPIIAVDSISEHISIFKVQSASEAANEVFVHVMSARVS